MKIHIYSVNPRQSGEHDQAPVLRDLWNRSDKRHSLTEDHSAADLCIACNISGPNWFQTLRENTIIGAQPGKFFAVHDGDIAMPLLHGIYTSAIRRMRRFRRIRGGAYNLFPKSTRNPLIEACEDRGYLHTKEYIASFWGQGSSGVRKQLFQCPPMAGVEIMDTTGRFSAFRDKGGSAREYHRKYLGSLLSSKFALCPRGASPSCIRLFEAMKLGVAPVIISNAALLPKGPDWKSSALVLDESRLKELPRLLGSNESRYREMGEAARQAYELYFQDSVYFNYLVGQMVEISREQGIPERIFWLFRNWQVKWYERQEIQLKNWR